MRKWTLKSHLNSLVKRTGPFQVPSDLDAIVIGGGVSGLATAATLSKAGISHFERAVIFDILTYRVMQPWCPNLDSLYSGLV